MLKVKYIRPVPSVLKPHAKVDPCATGTTKGPIAHVSLQQESLPDLLDEAREIVEAISHETASLDEPVVDVNE